MADMPVVNGSFKQSVTANGATTQNIILNTENTFVDKNIVLSFATPAAASPVLSINDATNTVTVGNASQGFFPLTNALTGKTTYGTAGWIGTNGLAAVQQSGVQVGTIAQSTMLLGAASLTSSSTVVPSVTASQTITISAGYEKVDRTITIAPMSEGDKAAATITASKTATTPTLANTASAQDGKTQITVSPTTATTGINKYYLALTAGAPATNFAATDVTKTITQAGYLSSNTQISAVDNAIKTTASSKIYYVPITTGAATVAVSSAATAPTATTSNASLSGKTALTGTPTTSASGISLYYIPFTVNAPATTIPASGITKTINTNGYIDSANQITVTAGTTASSTTYYMPVTSGALKANAGSVTANFTAGGVTGTLESTAPTGYYISITGSGQVGVQTAGWIPTSTTQDSSTATKYIALNTAEITENQAAGTISVSEGYVPSTGLSLNIGRGSISSGASAKANYANDTTTVPANGYLYISAGYYPNTQISLASLIPDDSTYTNATSDKILDQFEAYDSDGNKLVGTITTYSGSYTVLPTS